MSTGLQPPRRRSRAARLHRPLRARRPAPEPSQLPHPDLCYHVPDAAPAFESRPASAQAPAPMRNPDGGLLFGADLQLREGETLLTGFCDGAAGSYGCVLAGGREYDIVRGRRFGWDYSLQERDSASRACQLVPFHLRGGGHLIGTASQVTLRGVPLRVGRWVLEGDAGWRVLARVRNVTAREREQGWPHAAGLRGPLEVRLSGLSCLGVSSELPLLLAFGCWIAVQWQLCSTGSGGGG